MLSFNHFTQMTQSEVLPIKLTLRYLTYSIPFETAPEVDIEAARKHLEKVLRIPAQCFSLHYEQELLNPEKSWEYFLVQDGAVVRVWLDKAVVNGSSAISEINTLFLLVSQQEEVAAKVQEYLQTGSAVQLLDETLATVFSLLEMLKTLYATIRTNGGMSRASREKILESKVSSSSLQKVIVRLTISFLVLKEMPRPADAEELEFVEQVGTFIKCVALDVKATIDVLSTNGL